MALDAIALESRDAGDIRCEGGVAPVFPGLVFHIPDYNGVSGIISTLTSDDHIDSIRQIIDDFTLTFIPPLSAHQHCISQIRDRKASRI